MNYEVDPRRHTYEQKETHAHSLTRHAVEVDRSMFVCVFFLFSSSHALPIERTNLQELEAEFQAAKLAKNYAELIILSDLLKKARDIENGVSSLQAELDQAFRVDEFKKCVELEIQIKALTDQHTVPAPLTCVAHRFERTVCSPFPYTHTSIHGPALLTLQPHSTQCCDDSRSD